MVKSDEKIELKASLTAYPAGEGALLLPNFDTDFSLPVSYGKQGEAPNWFWQSDERDYGHQQLPTVSSRTVTLAEKSILSNIV
ncbi:hypothetical protein DXX93_08740 [Thalassotalea euphylliae]|uniref:Uncharacterized protein n=1 Tax=Thalassotalea euphylliae TaxID=1655234 RepID=A0A3E0TQ80_9GAMM|nr:hypothetical protein [Thalassotalea euphylliae]REL26656.1 hypothetical protein DXX93_08730 [Thalassotalea euphylliae]REL26658.1 hypothetical protein DXX93_08740 [Thalassotalea euphylliae]